jgi:hypothetical protein
VRQHLDEVEAQVVEAKPALVIVDPLYLAAAWLQPRRSLCKGEVFENIQAICLNPGGGIPRSGRIRALGAPSP